jgi:hypothetical protein
VTTLVATVADTDVFSVLYLRQSHLPVDVAQVEQAVPHHLV